MGETIEPGAALPTLLVHVGAGKTGTSSIQATLHTGRDTLRAQGVAWLGLMLDQAGPPRHPWQVPGGSDLFFTRLEPAVAAEQLHDVLTTALPALGARGVKLAVWSNEWMFQRPAAVLPALRRLREAGVPVRAVCYVRRIDAWLTSAYVQWGIKDKAHRGPVKPFREWRRGRNFALHRHVATWAEALGGDLALRNFDAEPDVVAGFLRDFVPGIALPAKRENETPDPALLAAWLVHNTGFADPVRPGRFGALVRAAGLLNAPPVPPLPAFMPSETDLAVARAEQKDDTARINALLAAQAQPPLDTDGPVQTLPPPTDWTMQVMLLRMVFSLQRQVEELRARLPDPPPGPR